jgi:Domain of Unknown Function (DUF1543)
MQLNLLMLLLGCRPPGRNTEQHDIFFGIGNSLKELIPAIKKSWPETKGNIHIDAWREVTCVDGYAIAVEEIPAGEKPIQKANDLFFINLGGYKQNEFDEFHYKMLVVAGNLESAKIKAKQTAFFKHTTVEQTVNSPHATSHIDDKFGIDIDDAYKLEDILPPQFKEKYRVSISDLNNCPLTDEYHLGYFRLVDL